MIDYIIADNQAISQLGMIYLLSQEKEGANILTADHKAELIKQLRSCPKAIVVLDYTLSDFQSIDDLLLLHDRFPEAMWLLFSEDLSLGFLRQLVLQSTAFSVVMKNSTREEIMTAIQHLSRKERFICNYVSNLLLASPTPQQSPTPPTGGQHNLNVLTSSEISILREISLGKTTKEIAAQKNLSFHTINSHRKNIFRKLEVNNVHEAIKKAMRLGIIDLTEYYI